MYSIQNIWQSFKSSKIGGFSIFLYHRFFALNVPQIAASLTFTMLLAIVPVLGVLLAAMTIFPIFARFSDATIEFINSILVPHGADIVLNYLDTFRQNAGSLTLLGISVLIFTSLMLFQTIDQAFNRIWRVETSRPLMVQIGVYLSLLLFGPFALGLSLSLWSIFTRSHFFIEQPTWLAAWLPLLSAILIKTILLFLLYRIVPNRFVPIKHALIGAFTTAILLHLAQHGFTLYISTFNSYTLIYGTFAAVPVFLVWLQLLWILLITGAMLTASLSYWRHSAFRKPPTDFDDAVQILMLLGEGKTLHVKQLHRHIHTGYDNLGCILEKLTQAGYIRCNTRGWRLLSELENITAAEIFTLFAYTTPSDPHMPSSWILIPYAEILNVPLSAFKPKALHNLKLEQYSKR